MARRNSLKIFSTAVVISDASPLICLAAIRQFNLLRLLHGEVLVPAAVWEEITRAPAFSPAASLEAAGDAHATGWLQVTTAGNRPLVTQLETVLDAGEAEAIALAVERAPSLLLIDERDGRHMARTLGVPLTGTLGVLLRAKALGHVPAIKPLLTELVQQHHFRLHPDLVQQVLAEAGEAY
jgi:predicted nucleic acid-binding protein